MELYYNDIICHIFNTAKLNNNIILLMLPSFYILWIISTVNRLDLFSCRSKLGVIRVIVDSNSFNERDTNMPTKGNFFGLTIWSEYLSFHLQQKVKVLFIRSHG